MSRLSRSPVYRGFRKKLVERCGREKAEGIWLAADRRLEEMERACPDMDGDSRMMILPAAAICRAAPEMLPLLKDYAAQTGKRIGKVIHALTCVPGVSRLLWSWMPRIMRAMSSPEKGYERRIVSESRELVGVDILTCPLHQAAIRLGVPEAAAVVCAMDKAYMTGFRYIQYTRTTALGEGDSCCDYRLRFDPEKR